MALAACGGSDAPTSPSTSGITTAPTADETPQGPSPGSVVITVEVTSSDGQAVKAYTITAAYEDLADRYDVNDDGVIDRDEAITAVADYFSGAIGREEVLAVIALYFAAA